MINKDKIRNLSIRQLANRVFIFDSSAADEKHFRSRLYQLAKGEIENYKDFRSFLWNEIYKRNDSGKSIKYLHFNERSQKLYVDFYFETWAKKAFDEIADKLKK